MEEKCCLPREPQVDGCFVDIKVMMRLMHLIRPQGDRSWVEGNGNVMQVCAGCSVLSATHSAGLIDQAPLS